MKNCYWPVLAGIARLVRAGVRGRTYALTCTPFGWNRALGLVQHLGEMILGALELKAMVLVAHLADSLVPRARRMSETWQTT